MDPKINIQPLSYKKREKTFLFLVLIFLVSLPFLYMYAAGYRFNIYEPSAIVSTGGMYIGVERTGAEIYIDDELVRETRTFRRAFYAQGLDVGTHRVHVQKEGYHTWVKELPVVERLVTEADAFNLPLVPQVRVISKWQTATGTAVVEAPLAYASSTNELLATSTKKTTAFRVNEEFRARVESFSTTTGTSSTPVSPVQQIEDMVFGVATSSSAEATTTVISSGVKLHTVGEDVYATWIGSYEEMPYYYCASDFPPYSTTTASTTTEKIVEKEVLVVHPVAQTVSDDATCDPTIRIDRLGQDVRDFTFYPGSGDLVIMILTDGAYVVEIDDRGWQNVQPLFLGEDLKIHIEGSTIYLYDGTLIYEVMPDVE